MACMRVLLISNGVTTNRGYYTLEVWAGSNVVELESSIDTYGDA